MHGPCYMRGNEVVSWYQYGYNWVFNTYWFKHNNCDHIIPPEKFLRDNSSIIYIIQTSTVSLVGINGGTIENIIRTFQASKVLKLELSISIYASTKNPSIVPRYKYPNKRSYCSPKALSLAPYAFPPELTSIILSPVTSTIISINKLILKSVNH